ncbi:fasciclin domain-containing protein [Phenylobacterium sp.]|uniref:fasciclin domain-containing protein n=1 Tax=Phenylobacterium sp. TaxID=1871053 RepID=UPI00286AF8D4|nr:fasciclin domain-containing protein [Phenylobacterium sp.]
MTTTRLLSAAAAVFLIAGAALAQTPATPAPATPAPATAAPMAAPTAKLVASGDITTTLRLSGQFTTFVKALDATNLSGLLQKQPNITVFAPTDVAFAALPPGELDKLMADKTGLQKLLIHHLINAPVPGSRIKGTRGPWPTGAGDKMVLDGGSDGVLKADNATIIQADVQASNGLIHVVDHVLIAGSVPEVLAPPAPPEVLSPPPEPAPAAKPPARVGGKRKK